MRKKSVGIGLLALFLLGNTGIVQAEEYTGNPGWKVEFTGKEMVSNFSSSDISEAVYALQPGDQVTIQLALRNGSQKEVDWYMTNQVLSSLEDSSEAARGGAYAYQLAYTDGTGAVTTLYSSENVGGEKDTKAGLGLREVDGLEDYVQLDRMASGEEGTVELMVALDGETQGNGYQNTLAKLQLAFAVEPVAGGGGGNGGGGGGDDGNTPRTPPPSTPTSATVYQVGSVQTGDASHILLWSAIALGAGLILTIIAITRLRQEKGGNDDEA